MFATVYCRGSDKYNGSDTLRAIGLLVERRIPVQEIDLNARPHLMLELMAMSDGQSDLPQIFLRDKHIGGLPQLIQALSELEEENDEMFQFDHAVTLMREATNGITIKNRVHHFKTYTRCFVGSECVDWMVRNLDHITSREEAVEFGRRLMAAGILYHVGEEHTFKDDNLFYRFRCDDCYIPSKKRTNGSLRSGFIAVTPTEKRKDDIISPLRRRILGANKIPASADVPDSRVPVDQQTNGLESPLAKLSGNTAENGSFSFEDGAISLHALYRVVRSRLTLKTKTFKSVQYTDCAKGRAILALVKGTLPEKALPADRVCDSFLSAGLMMPVSPPAAATKFHASTYYQLFERPAPGPTPARRQPSLAAPTAAGPVKSLPPNRPVVLVDPFPVTSTERSTRSKMILSADLRAMVGLCDSPSDSSVVSSELLLEVPCNLLGGSTGMLRMESEQDTSWSEDSPLMKRPLSATTGHSLAVTDPGGNGKKLSWSFGHAASVDDSLRPTIADVDGPATGCSPSAHRAIPGLPSQREDLQRSRSDQDLPDEGMQLVLGRSKDSQSMPNSPRRALNTTPPIGPGKTARRPSAALQIRAHRSARAKSYITTLPIRKITNEALLGVASPRLADHRSDRSLNTTVSHDDLFEKLQAQAPLSRDPSRTPRRVQSQTSSPNRMQSQTSSPNLSPRGLRPMRPLNQSTINAGLAELGPEGNCSREEARQQHSRSKSRPRGKDRDGSSSLPPICTSIDIVCVGATPVYLPPPMPSQPDMAIPGNADSSASSQVDDLLAEIKPLGEWNERLQKINNDLSAIRPDAPLHLPAGLNSQILELARDFVHTATAYGRIIIAERHSACKTIQPASSDTGGVYEVHDIVFKFAEDSADVCDGCGVRAAKRAGRELSGLIDYANCCVPLLQLPLMVLVDYLGHRLVATSTLPVSNSTLVYGSVDGGVTVCAESARVNKAMAECGRIMNLRPHIVGSVAGADDTVTLFSAGDVQGHKGTDGRLYAVNFARSMPPVAPDPGDSAGDRLVKLFRPEFIRKYPIALSPDAFSQFQAADPRSQQYNDDVRAATEHLLATTVPGLARELLAKIRDHMASRPVLEFNVSAAFHAEGVNLRYIGHVVQALGREALENRRSDNCTVATLLVAEAVARVAKRELRRNMRAGATRFQRPAMEYFYHLATRYLNLLFDRDKRASLLLWQNEIVPVLQHSFGFRAELLQHLTGMYAFGCLLDGVRPAFLVFLRVCDMLGLGFSPPAVTGFKAYCRAESPQEGPPLNRSDLRTMSERVKHTGTITYASGTQYLLEGLSAASRCLIVQASACFGRAVSKYQEVLALAPLNKLLLRNMALALQKLFEYQGLRDLRGSTLRVLAAEDATVKRIHRLHTQAVAVDPADATSHLMFAKFLLRCGKEADAEQELLRALERNPYHTSALLEYGQFLASRGNDHLAEQFFMRLHEVRQHRSKRATSGRAEGGPA